MTVHGSQTPRGKNIDNGDQRARAGVIVTFENRAGRTLSGHRVGPPYEALRGLIADALAIDPDFRIVSYSTPQTVYRDVVGRDQRKHDTAVSASPDLPERQACAKIGEYLMLHPRLRTAGRAGRRHDTRWTAEW